MSGRYTDENLSSSGARRPKWWDLNRERSLLLYHVRGPRELRNKNPFLRPGLKDRALLLEQQTSPLRPERPLPLPPASSPLLPLLLHLRQLRVQMREVFPRKVAKVWESD
ncbi:Dynein Heavy Chain 7, Axonemal [Manis pentadactyla]|nr:Dynein Heavy Chain 7, Axonemal [Manis pentadactyla]